MDLEIKIERKWLSLYKVLENIMEEPVMFISNFIRRYRHMGSYLNPGSERFQTSLRSQIYVDKTLLIDRVNRFVRTEQKYICVSRPRRFGKSMAADMLSAYYGKDDTSRIHNLFQGQLYQQR